MNETEVIKELQVKVDVLQKDLNKSLNIIEQIIQAIRFQDVYVDMADTFFNQGRLEEMQKIYKLYHDCLNGVIFRLEYSLKEIKGEDNL